MTSMNDRLPPLLHHFGSQADHPVVGQAGRHQQPRQSLGLAQMILAQVKPSALLVGEESLDAEALLVPNAGLLEEVQATHQQKRLFVAPLPNGPYQHRPQALRGEQNVAQFHAVARLQAAIGHEL